MARVREIDRHVMEMLLWNTRRAGRERMDEARALGADGAAAFYDGASPFVCPILADLAHEADWNVWQRGYWTARLLAEMGPFGGFWRRDRFRELEWRNLSHTVQVQCDQTKWDLLGHLLAGGGYPPMGIEGTRGASVAPPRIHTGIDGAGHD